MYCHVNLSRLNKPCGLSTVVKIKFSIKRILLVIVFSQFLSHPLSGWHPTPACMMCHCWTRSGLKVLHKACEKVASDYGSKDWNNKAIRLIFIISFQSNTLYWRKIKSPHSITVLNYITFHRFDNAPHVGCYHLQTTGEHKSIDMRSPNNPLTNSLLIAVNMAKKLLSRRLEDEGDFWEEIDNATKQKILDQVRREMRKSKKTTQHSPRKEL